MYILHMHHHTTQLLEYYLLHKFFLILAIRRGLGLCGTIGRVRFGEKFWGGGKKSLSPKERGETMDVGVWMDPGTLESKLEQQDSTNPEAAWNLARWPKGFADDPEAQNRLFVACRNHWIGYFLISKEMLYLPEDKETPYVLLFDTRTWATIPKVPVKRFRGFTYNVPSDVEGWG